MSSSNYYLSAFTNIWLRVNSVFDLFDMFSPFRHQIVPQLKYMADEVFTKYLRSIVLVVHGASILEQTGEI